MFNSSKRHLLYIIIIYYFNPPAVIRMRESWPSKAPLYSSAHQPYTAIQVLYILILLYTKYRLLASVVCLYGHTYTHAAECARDFPFFFLSDGLCACSERKKIYTAAEIRSKSDGNTHARWRAHLLLISLMHVAFISTYHTRRKMRAEHYCCSCTTSSKGITMLCLRSWISCDCMRCIVLYDVYALSSRRLLKLRIVAVLSIDELDDCQVKVVHTLYARVCRSLLQGVEYRRISEFSYKGLCLDFLNEILYRGAWFSLPLWGFSS